jgi:hypothetical protein
MERQSKFKVGDEFVRTVSDRGSVAEFQAGYESRVAYVFPDCIKDERGWTHSNSCIACKESGPVRTVTRKEIVPGKYGIVSVFADNTVHISCAGNHTPSELRDAARVFSELADALESSQ